MIPQQIFALPRGDICFVSQDRVVFQHGNSLVVYSVEDHLIFEAIIDTYKTGFTAFTANAQKGYIAFAPIAPNPPIILLRYPGNDVLCTLTNGPLLTYEKMSISCDGEYIYAISSPNEQSLYVFSVPSSTLIAKSQLPATTASFADGFISINPTNSDWICLAGEHGLVFGELTTDIHHERALHLRAASLTVDQADQTHDSNDEGQDSTFVAHSWGVGSVLYAANKLGLIFEFDMKQNVLRRKVFSSELGIAPICALVTFSGFLVAACSNGFCHWIDTRTGHSIEYSRRLEDDQIGHSTSSEILTCVPSPSHDYLLLLTCAGKICCLPTQVPGSLATRCIAECHTGAVVGMTEVMHDRPYLATVGVDGSLLLWNERMLPRGRYDFCTELCNNNKAPITQVGSSPEHPILGIGLALGVFYIMHIEIKATDCNCSITPLGNFQLFKHPITTISFHPDEMTVAVACGLEKGVYIIKFNPTANKPCDVAACILEDVDFCAISMIWQKEKLLVFANDASGTIVELFDVTGTGTNHAVASVRTICLEHMFLSTSSVLASPDAAYVYAVAPNCSEILAYAVTPSSISRSRSQEAEIQTNRGLLCLNVSRNARLLVTGDVNGTVVVHGLQANKIRHVVAKFASLHNGAILSVVFVDSDAAICSAGLDCAVFVSYISEQSHDQGAASRVADPYLPHAEHARTFAEMLVPPDGPTHQQALQAERTKELIRDAQAEKRGRRSIIDNLRRGIHKLLIKNDSASPLERLDRSEFVIDVNGRDQILKSNRIKLDDLRAKIDAEEIRRNNISAEIRAYCWDSMETQATQCQALLKKHPYVMNFPLSKLDCAAERQAACVYSLRKLEFRDIAAGEDVASTTWQDRANLIPSEINWIINEGVLSASNPDADATSLEKTLGFPNDVFLDRNSKEDRLQNDQDANSMATQLYQPTVLMTQNQKRVQILLIRTLIRRTQTSFNNHFFGLHQQKRHELEKIEEKNMRICSIIDELCIEATPSKSQVTSAFEFPETIFMVTDDEINATPCQNSMKVFRGAQQDLKQGMGSNSEATTRALDDMMHGSLDTKHDVSCLSLDLQPPSWFDESKSAEQLTEAQQKEMDIYTNAVQQLEEAQRKRRKALGLELKRLRAETQEIARSFNEQLRALFERRLCFMSYFAAQEFYLLRIGVSILDQESTLLTADSCRSMESRLKMHLHANENRYMELKQLLDQSKQRVESLRNEERQLERSFRRDAQLNAAGDPDVSRIVTKLYKQRPQDYFSAENSKGDMMGDLNTICTTEKTAQQPIAKLSDLEVAEIVGGFRIDQTLINRVQDFRKSKMQKENEISFAESRVQALEPHLAVFQSNSNCLKGEIQTMDHKRAKVQGRILGAEHNIDLLVQLKQEQDEVEQEAVVTDYSDAVLMPLSVVNGINDEIRRLGSEQVKVLNKIKQFRKSINFMNWENQYMAKQAHNLEEYYTDLQLLHVTKELQCAIKGNFGNQGVEYSMKVEAQIKMAKRAHDDDCTKLERANAKLRHQVQQRNEENMRLEQQVRELEGNVLVRESIVKSHLKTKEEQSEAPKHAVQNMRRIILRRRLIDLARLQTEEVDFLGQELDRLRQRTFPSFAHASRGRFND